MNDYVNENRNIKTADFCLATTLSLFYPIGCVDKSNPQRVQFTFVGDEKIKPLIDKFVRGELKVEPQRFFDQMKRIKAVIYND